MREFIRLSTLGVAMILGTAMLSACGGDSVSAVRQNSGSPILLAATATGCVYPSTAIVTTALPSAGGVRGTISIGAVASTSSTCSPVTVSTGASVLLRPSSASRSRLATTASTMPLVQVSLTNSYNGALPWLSLTLSLPTVSVPPGNYPATIAALVDGQLVTQEFTITVDANGSAIVTPPPTGSVLVTLAANETGVLAIYPMGTTFPTPSPTGTPTMTPSPIPVPTASPTTTPVPTASPMPTPVPTATSTVYSVSISPSTCIDAGNNAPTLTYTVKASPATPPAGFTYYYGWGAADIGVVTEQAPIFTSYEGNPVSTATAATVKVNTFPATGQTGEGNYMGVVLYLGDNNHPGERNYINRALNENGPPAVQALAPIAAGNTTCAQFAP